VIELVEVNAIANVAVPPIAGRGRNRKHNSAAVSPIIIDEAVVVHHYYRHRRSPMILIRRRYSPMQSCTISRHCPQPIRSI
jgi:hypothetical protein